MGNTRSANIPDVKAVLQKDNECVSSFDATELLIKALTIFSRCDKQGSIPVFTKYLNSRPNDPKALLWRGKAYAIIRNKASAISDFETAVNVSSGQTRLFALALLEEVKGNLQQCFSILETVVRDFPGFSEAKAALSVRIMQVDTGRAIPLMICAIDTGIENGETLEPWLPWACFHLGNMIRQLDPKDISSALKYYRKAVSYCSDLTVAHIEIAICQINIDDLEEAERSYLIARGLNPKIAQWENFAHFKQIVQDNRIGIKDMDEEVVYRRRTPAKPRQQSKQTLNLPTVYHDKRQKKGRKGRKSGRDSSSSSSESEADKENNKIKMQQYGESMFKKLQSGDKVKKGHQIYHKTKCGKFLVSRDTAGHGGAFLKLYKNDSAGTFVGSVTQKVFKDDCLKDIDKLIQKGLKQEHFDLMTDKHESRTGTNLKR